MEPLFLVGIGGAVGSILRFEFGRLKPVNDIPTGTLFVNIIGSFAFSILIFTHTPTDYYYLLGIGGFGGFTTFSTFSYETFRMLESHDYYTMGLNIFLNISGGMISVFLGYIIGISI